MKRKFYLLLAFFCLVGGSAWAQTTFTVGGLTYTVLTSSDKTVSVKAAPGASGSIVIPATVTYSGVTYTVTEVPNKGFYEADITSITFPASMKSLGSQAFAWCQYLERIVFEDSDEAISFNAAGGNAGTFYASSAQKTIYIGRNLNPSNNNAPFSNATSVEFGDKVTSINPNLFYNATLLSNVVMGSGITTIGDNAFQGAGTDDSLGDMVVQMGANVTSIGWRVFQGCTHLYNITLPSTLTTISNYAFEGTSLVSITFPASVTSLGSQAFASCQFLGSIVFEESEEEISFNAAGGNVGTFYGSSAQKTIYIGRNLNPSNNNAPFSNATSVEFGDKVTSINSNLFYNATLLSNVVMGSGITTIGDNAFLGAGTDDSLGDMVVQMGANVTSIGTKVFQGCTHLHYITLPSTLTTISDYAFAGSGLFSITFPASVTSLGSQAFASCQYLGSIVFEESDEAISFNAAGGNYGTFYGSSAQKTIYIGRNLNPSKNNAPFSNATSVEFGDKVTSINPNLFYNATLLSNVVMGSGITTIGDNAFQGAGTDDSLGDMVVQMGANVTSIGWRVFQGCTHLYNITLPSTLTTISNYAFEGTSLVSITFPASVTSLGSQAFASCQFLGSIVFEESEEEISFNAAGGNVGTFYGSSAQKTIYIGRNLNPSNNNAPFSNATSVEFGSKVTALPSNLFSNATTLNTVTAPWQTPINIAESVFSNTAYQNALLRVPGGKKQAYAAATGWKNFLNVDAWSVLVKLTASAHGSIATKYGAAANGKTVEFQHPLDEPIVYTVTADNGYKLSALTDNGTAVSPLPQLGASQSRDIISGEESVTLSATFAPVSYTITYDLAGGAMPSGVTNPTSYNIETASFTLNNPVREHYDFAGWTGTGLNAATKTVTIAKGSTGNRSYKATWERATYTVTISGAGVTASNYKPKYGESVTITIENDPDRTLVSLLVNGVDVTAQVVNGQYVIQNISGNVTVEATFKSTKEFITMTGEYATFSCPEDLNFSDSDLRAYIASGVNKNTHQVLLTRVTDVPAGTGVFLVGNPGTTYKIPYAESSSYYVNLFKANLQKSTVGATTGNYSNYTFGEQNGDPGFYPVNGSVTLLAQTAYLQLPTSYVAAGVKVSVVFEEDIIDGIEDFRISDEDATIYDIAGRRLNKTQRGINIVNGKKIVIK